MVERGQVVLNAGGSALESHGPVFLFLLAQMKMPGLGSF